MRSVLTFSLCIALLGSAALHGQSAHPVQTESSAAARALDEYFAGAEAFGFSGSVIVARGGQAILRKGYGYADRRTGLRNTPETVFGMSSVDKQIIAAAIMRLAEMGRLRVTDTLGTFFPALPRDKAGITLHQVLSHTSGIPNEYWDSYKDLDRQQFIRTVLEKPLVFAPGSGWEYSNANFWLLEEVIARAAHMPYERFLEEQLFRPAGMTATGFPSRGWSGMSVATYRPWTLDFPKNQVPDAEPLLDRPRWNWQLLTTADDMFKWYLALRDNHVINRASTEAMFTPVREQYGYGWNILPTSRGTRLVEHGGAGDAVGMTATIRLWIDEDVAVIVLANSTSPAITSDVIGASVESILFGGDAQMPPTAGASAPSPAAEGTYTLPDGGTFTIQRTTGGRLVAQSFDPRAIVFLMLPDLAAPLDSGDHNRDGEAALAGAIRGDFEPLRHVVRANENFDRRRAQMQDLANRVSKMGALQTVRTVYQRGYDRNGVPELQSFVHLHLEHGDAIVRVVTLSNGEMYFNWQGIPPIIELPLAPDAAGTLTAWNFRWGNATRFALDKSGGDTILRISGRRGSLSAKRK